MFSATLFQRSKYSYFLSTLIKLIYHLLSLFVIFGECSFFTFCSCFYFFLTRCEFLEQIVYVLSSRVIVVYIPCFQFHSLTDQNINICSVRSFKLMYLLLRSVVYVPSSLFVLVVPSSLIASI